MIEVIHVYPQLNYGGTEMVMSNLIARLPKDKYTVGVLTMSEGQRDKDFKELGCTLYQVPKYSNYKERLIAFFKDKRPDIVHTHTHAEMGLVMEAAKVAGVKVTVAHSHNAHSGLLAPLRWLHSLKVRNIAKYADVLLGCSEEALKWLFPMQYNDGKVIPNGIDINKFAYDAESRHTLRNEFDISDSAKVYLSVGRLTEQKNPLFIIETAKQVIQKDSSAVFIMVGDGPMKGEVKEAIGSLSSNIILAGLRTDTERFYSAADAFVFPSKWEGLGIVAVEAQAAGLPVFASTKVPGEADLGINIYTALPFDASLWADRLLNFKAVENRQDYAVRAAQTPYSVEASGRLLCDIYEKALHLKG